MTTIVSEFTAKRIVVDTPAPVAEVVARLDVELSKERAGPKLLEFLRGAKTRDELERGIDEISGGKDFVLFALAPHHNWRNAYNGSTDSPKAFQYTFGNPLVAQTMLRHDSAAALHVPLRLLVLEKADGTGTEIIYLLPSSVIAIPKEGTVHEELKAAAEVLDKKVERLVQTIVGFIPPSPGSPSGDSISSLPSVSSSFLFSSGPGSPPHSLHHPSPHHAHLDADAELHDSTQGLIIPSLALPSPARRPTPYGQMLGDLRLLVLAPRHAASSSTALVNSLLEENEDIVDLGSWEEEVCEDLPAAAILRASTDWVEHRDAHGLERTEPARNVEIVELPGYDPLDDVERIISRTLPIVHSPFYQISEALNPSYPPNSLLANLLSSSSTPLYTALILLWVTAPTQTEKALLEALSPHIPVIVLPPLPSHPSYPLHAANISSFPSSVYSSVYASPMPAYHGEPSTPATTAPLSAFRPSSPRALRTGLFRSPETLANLRTEAADRFLRWREVERAVDRICAAAAADGDARASWAYKSSAPTRKGRATWDKARWEAEWEGALSRDVAAGVQRRRRTQAGASVSTVRAEEQSERLRRASQACLPSPFDPLHAGSLVAFSFSLVGLARARLVRSISSLFVGPSEDEIATEEKVARRGSKTSAISFVFPLVGALCAGIGLGWFLAGR
ncbi:hypothetical protein WOLCODRAFT_134356 [Wolfiporia cocos MD-104 SS10]|uniref:DUF302 domain-containing protein n=1 Tax=Wolfiporia cocos (strain MD-104) TaxID=742152 RepID=A0A2H3JJG3_WOLCO|nr:hypothetical protein WOLCODRAFT_134356 [Wolfiporia cocos MD-104 SS10]